jgi:RNA polymerase sigma factor (sigma-70 family)
MILRGEMEERRAAEAEIEEERRLTFAIAYRMTGSVSDAEDIGQEAFLRLERARRDGEALSSPRAWLSTVTTRLAIDHMRSARARRESYVGPWLPEPLLTEDCPGPAEHAEVADSVSQAFLVMLEALSPVERAVFLLRDIFGYDYPQIAEAVGKGRRTAGRSRLGPASTWKGANPASRPTGGTPTSCSTASSRPARAATWSR